MKDLFNRIREKLEPEYHAPSSFNTSVNKEILGGAFELVKQLPANILEKSPGPWDIESRVYVAYNALQQTEGKNEVILKIKNGDSSNIDSAIFSVSEDKKVNIISRKDKHNISKEGVYILI